LAKQKINGVSLPSTSNGCWAIADFGIATGVADIYFVLHASIQFSTEAASQMPSTGLTVKVVIDLTDVEGRPVITSREVQATH
jgi:hypothetical protein